MTEIKKFAGKIGGIRQEISRKFGGNFKIDFSPLNSGKTHHNLAAGIPPEFRQLRQNSGGIRPDFWEEFFRETARNPGFPAEFGRNSGDF